MKEHPWFKFYPARWLGDPHLRILNASAKGVLIDMMAIAHDGVPYGYVTNGGLALTEHEIAKFTHERVTTVQKVVTKLLKGGRIAKTSEGTFYIPSMVRMAEQHKKHVRDGSKGGNPDLMDEVNHPVNPPVNPEVKVEKKREEKEERRRGGKTGPPQIGAPPTSEKTEKKSSPKQKKVLDWNSPDMLEYFEDRHSVYGGKKQPKGKSAALLKSLIKDIGAERTKEMVDYLFDNWDHFSRKLKIKSGSPSVAILYGYSTSIHDELEGRGQYDPSSRGSQQEYPEDPFNQGK